MIEFRCPRCSSKLADVDEACPQVNVLCRQCRVERIYRPPNDPHHWDYARLAEPVYAEVAHHT